MWLCDDSNGKQCGKQGNATEIYCTFVYEVSLMSFDPVVVTATGIYRANAGMR